jgi:hypothetical protein
MNTATSQQRWDAYLAAFAATDHDERARLLEACVAEDVVFTNPAGDGRSLPGLHAHIDTFQAAYPGAYFSTEKLYPQADKLLAQWTLYRQDGVQVATGYNFVRFDADGRFDYMAGFF